MAGVGAGHVALHTPVNYLKGVGPRRADAFRRIGVFTAHDLLLHIPHRYEDATTVMPIARLEVGTDATVIGTGHFQGHPSDEARTPDLPGGREGRVAG